MPAAPHGPSNTVALEVPLRPVSVDDQGSTAAPDPPQNVAASLEKCTAASASVRPSADPTGTPEEANAAALHLTPLPHAVSTQPVMVPISCPLANSCKATASPEGPTRTTKRTIQGKYEDCYPILPKRQRINSAIPSSSSASGNFDNAGKSNLNSPTEVVGFIAQHDPDLVFLCETHLKQSSNSRIQFAFNMEGCFVVDYGSGCTGLMLLWNRRITVNLLSYSSIHINIIVASVSGSFHFSGLHGHCVDKHKHLTWSLIDRLRSSSALSWLVGVTSMRSSATVRRRGSTVSGAVIQERLDRFMATTNWLMVLLGVGLATTSVLILVGRRRMYVLRESVLLGCALRIPLFLSFKPLVTLRCWQADRRASSAKRMSDLQVFLNSCMQDSITDAAKAAFLDAKREHKSLLDKDKAYWAQRARVTWLTQGDRNTAYFHARASGRRKMNRMQGLFKENGIWTDKQAEVAGVAMRYFTTLFSSSQPTPNSSLLSNIDHCISSDDNTSLLRPFTDAEIIAAFQDINPTKAPDIDGLPGSFFRQHWELISSYIIQLCHDLLSRKIDMSCVNATVITLIPKVEDPVRMQQLRPISLCTVVYKIVSKTILNRMKPFLLGCISENQSAFLKGRLIFDNILIAHELLHYLCSFENGSNKGVALKLDMEKAFDRVEWTFIRNVLLRMGFHSDWVDLLMDCVSTVTFRILGLFATLLAEQAAGRILGIRASQKGPRVNHLLYADDSIVFIHNSEREASRLKEVLCLFADSSGQRINFGKSTVFYSSNTPLAHRHCLSSILGKNKTNTFGFLNEKVDGRVAGWTKRLLSFGDREIFLKYVAQALPFTLCRATYCLALSLIDLPLLCAGTGGRGS
ncbi:hypothetical protein GQ457_12G031040 [Hibiscus cannabinus]